MTRIFVARRVWIPDYQVLTTVYIFSDDSRYWVFNGKTCDKCFSEESLDQNAQSRKTKGLGKNINCVVG